METTAEDAPDRWESIAATHSWGRYLAEAEGALIERATALAGRPGTVLETGCETGRWLVPLHEQGWTVRATDVRQDSLDLARKRLPEAEFTLVDPHRTDLPCQSEAIDLLVCMEVAPVINAAWFPNEARRVLKSGGLLVGTFWNRSSWRGTLSRLQHERAGDEVWYPHRYREWKVSMEALGMEFLEEVGLCWLPFARDSNSPLVPLAVRAEERLGLRNLIRWSPWVGFVARRS